MKYITPYRETKPFTPSLPGNTLSKSRQYTPFSTIIFLYRTIKTNYYPPTYLYIYNPPYTICTHAGSSPYRIPHEDCATAIPGADRIGTAVV